MKKGTIKKATQLKKALARTMRYNNEFDYKLSLEGHCWTDKDTKRYDCILRAKWLLDELMDELENKLNSSKS